MTTVCSPSAAGVHCSCEMGYVWPCDKCKVYGKCENDTTSSCNCINAIPEDGQICQSVQGQNNTQCTIPTPTPETVCSPSAAGVHCSCEMGYVWPCDKCKVYGKCENDTTSSCNCINAIPEDGQICQSVQGQNNTQCTIPTPTPETDTTANTTTEMDSNSTVPTTVVTTPAFLYRYNIYFKFNTTDSSVMNRLRIVLRNVSSHISANGIHINSVDVSTVCSPNNSSYQCTCEEKYRWPCDLCLTHGSCDNISNDTCGCIHGLPPDGQYCQPLDSTNFTVCPSTTPVPTSEVTSLKPTTETNVTTLLPVTNTTDNPTTEMNSSATTVPTTAVTTPVFLYRYNIYFEFNTTNSSVMNRLRIVLRNVSSHISANGIHINSVDVSTVCSPNNSSYQCTCEEKYRWPCDLCLTHGSCDNISNDTCGCIHGLPPDGQYCQPLDSTNFTVCPSTTPVPTSVCSPNNSSYQCTCEEKYRWPCDLCLTHGSCDNISNDTCGCIHGLPPDGQYCQPLDSTNFTVCPSTTPVPTSEVTSLKPTTETNVTTLLPVTNTTDNPTTEMNSSATTVPTTAVTTPIFLYRYNIYFEFNTTNSSVMNRLRIILRNVSSHISANGIHINSVDVSTVCSPNNSSYQCTCEEKYRWPCDLCLTHGSCDNISNDTCGCIHGLPPDGQYCQPLDSTNFTVCPSTTPVPTSEVTSLKPTTETNVTTLLPVTNTTDNPTTEMNSSATTVPTTAVTSK
uniref:ADGRF3/5-like N-terminal domain-containing protein n=1 Tax=Knipowitschia caucasica TaxID=637954 RepID=A0AAV2KF50_KNICA